MIRLALRGLAARKARTILTAFAVVLGVAMVSGSFVLTDTISKAFDEIFVGAYAKTDAVVTSRTLVDYSSSGNATVGERTLARVRSLPHVDGAVGSIIDLDGDSTQARMLDRDGKVIQSSGNPNFGIGVDPSQPRFNPMHLVSGAWAHGPHEVVVDQETATKHHFRVGDSIRVAANGPTRSFRISGIARFGDVSTLGGATFAVWDIATARAMLGLHGYTALSVGSRPGTSAEALVRELRAVLPGSLEVRTGEEQGRKDVQDIAGFISFIRGVLLAFGGISLLVGAFVIFNSLSMTVAQRTRELATLRTLGASRRQVLRAVVVEAAAIGVGASALGIGAGIGLARGLSVLMDATGLSLPRAGAVYAPRTFVIALVVGIGVTVLAGLLPALRATRVAPIAAVREGAVLTPRRRFGTAIGAAMLVGAVALLAYALLGGGIGSPASLIALGAGSLLLVVGTAGVASRLVTALTSVLGTPSRRFGGVAGRLAVRNARRNPSRTAATAAALMVGLAIVTFVTVLAAGVRDSYANAVRGQIDADWVVTSENGWSAFPVGAGERAARAEGVVAATSIRSDRGLVGTTQANVNAVDPRTLSGLYRFSWTQGSDRALSRLNGNGAVVKEAFARKLHLATGDAFTLRAPNGRSIRLVVAGIYQPPRVGEVLGGVVLGQRAFDRVFPRPQNGLTLVRGSSAAALERALGAFPATKVQTRADYVTSQTSFIGSILNILYVMLALSVVVSLFGMVNTLALSVIERTRELGMLRVVGLSRRQARRMVRHESVITALIGAGLGLPLGTLLAAGVTHALGRYGVAFALPVGSLLAFAAVAFVCGVLAAVAPARRAARLDVLRALQYE